ncbi:MAG: thioredoxin family protein [Pirellulaceae bacterium]
MLRCAISSPGTGFLAIGTSPKSARLVLLSALALLLAGCGGAPPPGVIATADQGNFRRIVVDSKRPVLVEFWSHSCEPCKALEPHLAALAREHHELLVVKVNADENQPLVEDLGVRLLPTLFVYQDGVAMRTKVGAPQPAELAELVSAYVTPK